ncbi:MAG: ABC transporter permease [Dehalococcoidia bacterium]|nr:ABC transporter permease [Dehalococcoidia bacterium]
MLRFIGVRLLYAIVVLLVLSVLVFALAHKSGDPRTVMLTAYTSQEQWDAWGKKWGLDKPLIAQYGIWLGRALRGNLGESLRELRPVSTVIAERIPATLQLAGGAFAFSILIGVPFGVLSAIKRGSALDYAGRTIALFGQALPPFWLGIVLILIFAVRLKWLPTSGRGDITHYILPSVTLGWLTAAGMLRIVRSSMLEVMDTEYIRFARAKGVSFRSIVWKHALRNAMLAPLTFGGLVLAGLITGAVVTETVFAWPGLGRLAIQSVNNNDFPAMTGVVMVFAIIYLGVNTVLDAVYALVDPRIRY